MRQPLIRRGNPGMARAREITLPAPFGGINAIDALAGGMEPTDAVDMVNFYPIDGGIETRGGFAQRQDLGTGVAVPFVQAFDDGNPRTIVASGGKLFRVTTVPTEMASGFTSDRWSHAVLNNRMFLVNGEDAPQAVHGAAVIVPEFTAHADETRPLDTTKFFRVRAHAKRLFFAERGSAAFWYANLNSVQGQLRSFDLSGVGNRGGTIIDIATMTPDGGQGGDDDAIVFFMSSGEAIVYRGSDPGDMARWGRVGVFPVARPIVVASHAGDVLTVSADGYAELSRVLPSGRSPVAGFGARMSRMALREIAAVGMNPGWQIIYHPAMRMILVNIPQSSERFEQHVVNAATGAWARFVDLPAVAWGHIGQALVFGTPDGKLMTFGTDRDGDKPILAHAQGAWNPLGAPGRKKKVNLVRPFFTSTSTPSVQHLIGADFRSPVRASAQTVEADEETGIWNQSVWEQARWGGSERVIATRRGGGAAGDFLSVGLHVESVSGRVKWLATSLMTEFGA